MASRFFVPRRNVGRIISHIFCMACVHAMDSLVEVGTMPSSVACRIVRSANSLLSWRSALDTVARCGPLNTVWCHAYKIIGSNNVLMPGQHNEHWCCAVLSWGLPDHCSPIFGAQ